MNETRAQEESDMSVFPIKVLLATDGSEDAAQAREAAADLARRSGSELHLVHVWHDVPSPYAHTFVKRELRRQGQEVIDAQVKKIEDAGGTVTAAHLRGGRTSDEVIELSEELGVGLLILGSSPTRPRPSSCTLTRAWSKSLPGPRRTTRCGGPKSSSKNGRTT